MSQVFQSSQNCALPLERFGALHTTNLDEAQTFFKATYEDLNHISCIQDPFSVSASGVRANSVRLLAAQGQNFSVTRGSAQTSTFFFPFNGNFAAQTGGKEISMTSGTKGILSGGANLNGLAINDGTILGLTMSNGLIEGALDHFGCEAPIRRLLDEASYIPDFPGIEDLRTDVEFFAREYDLADWALLSREVYDETCEHVLANSVARMLVLAAQRGDVRVSDSVRQHRAAVDYIHEHFAVVRTLSQIGSAVNMSVPALDASFKRHEGCTPGRYLAQLRLTFAQKLFELHGPAASQDLVAAQCGFLNARQMHKAHKEVYHTELVH